MLVKMNTEAAVTGSGESSDGRSPVGLVGTIEDLEPPLDGIFRTHADLRFRVRRGRSGGIKGSIHGLGPFLAACTADGY